LLQYGTIYSLAPNEEPAIKVAVRVRPFVHGEEYRDDDEETAGRQGAALGIDMSENKITYWGDDNLEGPRRLRKSENRVERYRTVDECLWSFNDNQGEKERDADRPFASQAKVFERIGQPRLDQFWGPGADGNDGFDISFVTFGQSGTGKSHTLYGPWHGGLSMEPEDQGLVLRTGRALFQRLFELKNAGNTDQFELVMTMHELYNGSIYDLLVPHTDQHRIEPDTRPPLETKLMGRSYVPVDAKGRRGGMPITSEEDMSKVLQRGHANQTKAPTLGNPDSDRAHTVITIWVEISYTVMNKRKPSVKKLTKRVTFVDLAGSENDFLSQIDGLTAEDVREIYLEMDWSSIPTQYWKEVMSLYV
jgi:hypothetical protein